MSMIFSALVSMGVRLHDPGVSALADPEPDGIPLNRDERRARAAVERRVLRLVHSR